MSLKTIVAADETYHAEWAQDLHARMQKLRSEDYKPADDVLLAELSEILTSLVYLGQRIGHDGMIRVSLKVFHQLVVRNYITPKDFCTGPLVNALFNWIEWEDHIRNHSPVAQARKSAQA